MGTFLTSVTAVLFYVVLSPFYPSMNISPDWLLGILFGIGGLAGTYIGARLQKFMPAKTIKWIIGAGMLFLSIRYILSYIWF